MSSAGDLESTIGTIGRSLIVLLILSVVIGTAFGAGLDILGHPETADVEPTPGSFVDVGGELTYAYGITAQATLENALSFDGSNAVTASAPENVSNGSWTACSTVQLGDDTNLNATYDVIAYDNESILLQYDAGSWAVYHDNGTHDARASIDAPSPRGTSGGILSAGDPFTSVCGRYNATANELVVTRDDSISSPAPLTTSTASRNTSWEWVGRQDEVRLFNSSVSNGTIQSYAADPIQPLPGTDRSVRFLFDEGEGTTTHGYFANVEASTGGAEWTDGVAKPGISSGDDYEFERNPLRIKAVSGGYLDGAPVVFVIQGGNIWYNLLNTFGSFGSTAFVLIALGLIAIGASWINDELLGGGGGGR